MQGKGMAMTDLLDDELGLDQEHCRCPVCGCDDVAPIGALGAVEHYLCGLCGWQWHERKTA